MTWMDTMVTGRVRDRLVDPKVRELDYTPIPGFYHHLKIGEHTAVEVHLSTFFDWTTQCSAADISTGTCLSVVTDGRGSLEITQKQLGPFLG